MKSIAFLKSMSIRTKVILTFIVLTAVTLIILGAIIFSNWINSAHEVTSDLSKQNSEDIALQISGFLDNPIELNEAYEKLISNNYVDIQNQEERERFFLLALENYDSQVYSFSFGTVNGEYYGARRNEDGELEIMRNDISTGGVSWYYSVDDNYIADERVVVAGLFDPRTRSWYIEAENAGDTVFSPVYKHFIIDDLAVSLATPIYNDQGVFQGVLGTHMVLTNINTFLINVLDDNNGSGIIIDMNSNELVANSMGLANYIVLEDNSVSRIKINELENLDFNKAYQQYLSNETSNFEFRDNLEYVYYSVQEVHENGLDWLIITSIPQGDLFARIIQNIYWLIFIFVASTLALIMIYHFLIQKLFKPIDELVGVSNEFSHGDFSKRLQIEGKDEFSKLAYAFNSMADHIKDIVLGLEQTIYERTEHLRITNETLYESEQRFKILHDASFGGLAIHDHGLILDCNQGLCDITGFTLDELINMDGLKLIAPDYRDVVMENIKSGYEKPYEVLGIKKNGEIYPLKLEARNLPYNGKQVRVVEFRDISEIKKQESEKKLSEEKYHLLFETMIQGVVYQNSEGFITSCNPRAEEILGLSLDQMQGKTSMDPRWKMIDEDGKAISGEDHPAMIALKNKKMFGPTIRGVYIPELDVYKWLSITAIPLFVEGEENPHQVYATFEDITEQIKSNLEVSYRKELLQYIISRSNQGIAVHDKDLNYVYVSDRYCDMYKIDNDIIGKHHYDVFPDLPQKWRDVHQRSLKGETLSGDRDPIERLDGSVQYTRWLCQPWYDVNGEIAGIIVYTEVINDLVDTEIKLEEMIARLQLVMDNLTIGIAVNSVDPEVEFEYMNENFPKFYNTTKEALMNPGSFWDVVYEDEEFREEIKQKVLKGLAGDDPKLKRWEYIPITRNGKIVRYINAQGVNIPNSKQIISMVMDVTEQKQKEDKIIYTSNHDFLTGLPNRRYFEQKLQELDQEQYLPLVVSMFDFDGLKLINDAYGHDAGDVALIEISKVLIKSLGENDFVARIGGDEFVMLSPNTTTEKFEQKLAFIRNKVKSIRHLDINYSLSSGYDIKLNVNSSTNETQKNAENNMFANKTLHGQSARSETIMTIFEALKEKYDEEKKHSDRVSRYCRLMGEKLKLSQDQIKEIEYAGLMHDIGKITIPDSILDKPGKLTDEEWVIMRKHTINGYQILKSADKYSRLAEYALTHHERIDGNGYPNGLVGDEIPKFSRIICIADAYEAMTSDRPYRKALSKEVAINELYRCSGSQFDADIVDIFVNEVLSKE